MILIDVVYSVLWETCLLYTRIVTAWVTCRSLVHGEDLNRVVAYTGTITTRGTVNTWIVTPWSTMNAWIMTDWSTVNTGVMTPRCATMKTSIPTSRSARTMTPRG